MFVTKPPCVKLVEVKHLITIFMLFRNTWSVIQTIVGEDM